MAIAALHAYRSHKIPSLAKPLPEACSCPGQCSNGLTLFVNRPGVTTTCSRCQSRVVSNLFKGCYQCKYISCPRCNPLPSTITEEDLQLAKAATASIFTRNAEISQSICSHSTTNARTKPQPVSDSVRKQLWIKEALNGRIIQMPKDGHCLFHAIGRACKMSFIVVRRHCVAYMAANPERFIEKVAGRSWQQYLIDMSNESRVVNSKSYGDDLAICALSCILRRPILVIYKCATELNFLERNPFESTEKPIYLRYDSNLMHYDLVQ